MDKHKIEWIQGLRGIAASMVVLAHFRFHLPGDQFKWIDRHILYPGAMGVDLFFMVSGYIMVLTTSRLKGGVVDAREFLVKRFARIWPVYAVVSLLAIPIIHGMHYFTEHTDAIVRSLLFLPVNNHELPYLGLPLGIGWTLNYEAYFYLIIGICLLFGKWRWHVFYAWLSITLILVPILLGSLPHLDPRISYGVGNFDFILNPIIWEFAIGVFVAQVTLNLNIALRSSYWKLASAAVITCCLAMNYLGPLDFSGINQWGAPLGVLFLTIAILARAQSIKTPKVIHALGERSYSIYLTHQIAIGITAQALFLLGLKYAGVLFIASSVPIIIVVAWVSWATLEVRLSKTVRGALLGRITPPRSAQGAL